MSRRLLALAAALTSTLALASACTNDEPELSKAEILQRARRA
ncbi:MAG: hypothetical protein R2710_13230 [Acidimicrobiales bacterium]